MNKQIYSIGIRALTVGSKFLLILVLARLLPVDQVGLYGIVSTTILIALQVLGLDFYAFNTRELLKVQDNERVVYIRDQWLVHGLTYLAMLPLFLFVFKFHVMPWSILLWFYTLLILEHNAQELDRLLITLSRPILANVVMFFRSGIWVLGFLIYAHFREVQLTTVWIFWVMGDLLALGIGAFGLKHLPWLNAVRISINWSWIKHGIRVAFIFLLGTVSVQLLFYMNRYFIQFILGMKSVGIFVFFGSMLGVIFTFAQVGIFNFIVPNMIEQYHKDKSTLVHSIRKMYKMILLYLVVTGIGASVCIYIVLWLVHQPEYANYMTVFYLLLIGVMITVLGQVPHYGLYISYHEKRILKISFITLLLSIVINFVFIKFYGLSGAALANIMTMLLLGGLKQWFFYKEYSKLWK